MSSTMASINNDNVDFSKLVIYGYFIHHQNPRIMNYYTHPHRMGRDTKTKIHEEDLKEFGHLALTHLTKPSHVAYFADLLRDGGIIPDPIRGKYKGWTDGAPYPAWLAMGNAAAAEATEPAGEESRTQPAEGLGNLYTAPQRKRRLCFLVIRTLYVVKCVINILLSIGVIAVTVSTAIAIKMFSSDQSGRLVAMIILSVTSAITLSMTIYAMVAVLRKQTKPIHAAAIVLLVLALIEAIIIAVSVRVTETAEINISRSLSESFNLATEDSPRHVKLWSNIQHDLGCCGVYSPQDFKNQNLPPYFAPDVPIACCPGYDPNRSQLVQERERQMCKARKAYYDVGCRNPILDMYRETAKSVIAVTSVHITIMLLLVIVGVILTKKMERRVRKTDEAPTSSIPELSLTPQILVKTKTNTKV